ncbi:MAG: FAD-binding oxidoreductase [Thermodesulfobacteriota bacterium]
MTLERSFYKALEDTVGPENISEEPAIMDSYAWRSGMMAGMTRFVPRFDAVVLPGSVEDVQAVVRLCNRRRVQFKSSSTGWGASSSPGTTGTIHLDLRRMNRIIEINQQHLYAVVEPYVIGAQLQAELMKRGLNYNVNGAGSQTSALPLAAGTGHGFMSQTTGLAERNTLGVEWVTPEGEVIRFGSLGSSGEWFSGDGPGPSLRSLIRGAASASGGIGVFTKAATKVYHWPGPERVELQGTSPRYAPVALPDNFLVRFFSFPSTSIMVEAARKIGESEISLQLSHSVSMLAASIATCNEEDLDLLKQYRKMAQGPGFVVAICGNSVDEFEYKKKVLQTIIDETGGQSLSAIEEPKVAAGILWRFIRMTTAVREAHRATGVWFGMMAGHNYSAIETKFIQTAGRLKDELIEKGLIFDGDRGLVDLMVWPMEHGHRGLAEVIGRYFPNPETMSGIEDLREECRKVALNEHAGGPYGVSGDELQDRFGPHYSNYHTWLREMKKAFDPNGVAESTFYISGGP